MKKSVIIFLMGLLLIFTAPISSNAYDLPSINLGFTSFMDGAPPSGPGLYYAQYIQYWGSGDFKDAPGTGEDLDAWISLSQFIYQSDTEVMLGAKWGIDVILPYVSLDLSYPSGGPFLDNGSGMGDLWVGPYLQWDPVMGPNGPRFMQRIEFQLIFPTGDYDINRELNQGSNVFTFNPYWAATYFFTPRFTASTRIHYLWNGENDEPNRYDVLLYGAHETQAGQAIHLNFASSYDLIPNRLRVGINGYYLKGITDKEVNGNDITGMREKVFAIGPGLLYSFNRDAHLFFNSYYETGAENRPEGGRINLRFVYHF